MSAIPLPTKLRNETAHRRLKRLERTAAMERLLVRTVVFMGIAGFVFMTSSLAGNVMLENVRIEGKKAFRRTVAAKEHQSTLQRQVSALTSNRAVANWARSNGFIATEFAPASSSRNSRVALNR